MTKKNKEFLDFILALSPAEKQQFKKQYSGDFDFIHLFDFIVKQKKYDVEKIRKRLIKLRGKEKAKKYTSGYISVLKNYLKERLVDSLRRQAYNKRRTTYEVLIRSINADVLMEKGFPKMAKAELEIAKNLDKAGLFPIEKLLTFRKESLLNFYENYQNVSIGDLENLFQQRLFMAEQMMLEIKYAHMLSILTYCQTKGLEATGYIKKIEEDPIMQTGDLKRSFGPAYLYYWVNGLIAEHKKKKEEAIVNFSKAVQLWLDHPDYIELNPRMYWGTCYAYLKVLLKHQSAEKMVFQQEDIQKLLNYLSSVQLAPDEELRHRQIFLLYNLIVLKGNEDFEGIEKSIPQVKEVLSYKELISDYLKLAFHFHVAEALANQKKFSEAMDWLDFIFVTQEIKVASNENYYTNSIFLYLLLHLEMGNTKFLKYELKKQENTLKKLGALSPLYKTYLQQIQKILNLKVSKKTGIRPSEILEEARNNELNEAIHFNKSASFISMAKWLDKMKTLDRIQAVV